MNIIEIVPKKTFICISQSQFLQVILEPVIIVS